MHDLDPMNSNPGAGCVCPDDQNECDNTNPSPFLPTSPLPPHSPTLTPPPVALRMMEITVDKVEAHFPYAKYTVYIIYHILNLSRNKYLNLIGLA